jgi:hypothetical protein
VTVDQTLQDTNYGYTGDVNRYLIAELQKTLLHITLSFLTEFFCQKETRRKGFSPSETSDLITGLRCRIWSHYKAEELKNIPLSYILQGVIIGDDRTLVAEGRDVFVNTVKL